jgi:hypothetical protein
MSQYFVHNGYSGWSYGTPSDPQLVSTEDAVRLMQAASLSADQVALILPPAQYAETGDSLFKATSGNRFIFFGDGIGCADIDPCKVATALVIDWAAA